MFGKKFNIKYKKIILPVILIKDDTTDALKKYNITFYTLLYDQFEKTDYLFPFRIFFIDPIKYTNKNESFITDIHRASNITGSEIVQIEEASKNSLATEYEIAFRTLSNNDYIRVVFSRATDILDTVDPFLRRVGVLEDHIAITNREMAQNLHKDFPNGIININIP